MDTFFNEYEEASLAVFKRFPETQKERIQELYKNETQAAQEKLEAEALKKWEENKKEEEAKAAEEAKKGNVDPKAKKAPPAKAAGKGAKDGDKPVLDVPKLVVPAIKDYKSSMGNAFIVERSLYEITEKLMKPAPLDEDENG